MSQPRALAVPDYRVRGLSMEARYEAYVERTGPDTCWGWTGPTIPGGYGVVRAGGKVVVASRFAWEKKHGPIPTGLCVLHHCDNPPCTNPRHLAIGTRKQNTHDARDKGRLRSNRPYIRHDELALLFCEGLSYPQLAQHFGCTEAVIAQTLHRMRRDGFTPGARDLPGLSPRAARFSHAAALAMAARGLSTRAIGTRLGVTGVAILKLLRRNGWVPTREGWKKGESPEAKAEA